MGLSRQEILSQDRQRREWAEAGADFAHFLIQFLRGLRRLPIQQSEIKATQLYLRSNAAEQRALEMVCDEPEVSYIDPEQKRELAHRDGWLMLFAEGKNLGARRPR